LPCPNLELRGSNCSGKVDPILPLRTHFDTALGTKLKKKLKKTSEKHPE
jgi:hypothetical protein